MAKWIDVCAVCGANAWTNIPAHEGKPAVGYCGDHREAPSAAYNAWREARIAQDREAAVARGVAFWEARGIKPGDAVRVWGQSMFGAFPIHGVARVGASGPYVKSPKHRRQLDAAGAEKI